MISNNMNETLKLLIEQARQDLRGQDLPFEQGLEVYSERLATSILLEACDWITENVEPVTTEQQIQMLKHFGIEQ